MRKCSYKAAGIWRGVWKAITLARVSNQMIFHRSTYKFMWRMFHTVTNGGKNVARHGETTTPNTRASGENQTLTFYVKDVRKCRYKAVGMWRGVWKVITLAWVSNQMTLHRSTYKFMWRMFHTIIVLLMQRKMLRDREKTQEKSFIQSA